MELEEECEDSELDLPCGQLGNCSELYEHKNLQDVRQVYIVEKERT
jgi:hypothetical protein